MLRALFPAPRPEDFVREIAELRLRNETLEQENAVLRVENACMMDYLATHSDSDEVVRLLCAKGESAKQAKLADTMRELQLRVATMGEELQQCKIKEDAFKHIITEMGVKYIKRVEDQEAHIFQLEASIASLQDANDSKNVKLSQLRRSVHQLRDILTCSISREPMTSPCILSTGQVYEHEYISQWLARANTCPNTNVEVHDYVLQPNAILRNVCAIIAGMV
jgi:2-succinyl-5-enolpyruvyl-6-hydroxy-3-cyclohexene-1-carboxylate synthase